PPAEVRRGGPAVPPAPGSAARSRGRRADAGADPARPARDRPVADPRVSGGAVVLPGPVRPAEGTPHRAGRAGRSVPPGDPAGTRRAETAPADPDPRLLRHGAERPRPQDRGGVGGGPGPAAAALPHRGPEGIRRAADSEEDPRPGLAAGEPVSADSAGGVPGRLPALAAGAGPAAGCAFAVAAGGEGPGPPVAAPLRPAPRPHGGVPGARLPAPEAGRSNRGAVGLAARLGHGEGDGQRRGPAGVDARVPGRGDDRGRGGAARPAGGGG